MSTTPSAAWRTHSGGVAWPTVALTLALWLLVPGIWAATLSGAIPQALGSLGITFSIYVAFTPLHEATHGNVGGGAKRAWMDSAVGWACSVLFFAPYPAFKAVHLRHHGTVNCPEKDPDMWVAGSNALSIAARCWTIVPHYYRMFLGPMASPANRQARYISLVTLLLQLLVAGALIWAGQGWNLLTLWLLPAWAASGLLVLVFDWLPHQPFDSQERWHNARVMRGRLLNVLFLYQNLHLIHHLWPRVPWYHYEAVFELEREELERHGAEIWERGH